MQRSSKNSLHIILALLLITAPFQMAVSGDMEAMNHTFDAQHMADMSNMTPDCQNGNSDDTCNSNHCSTDSCCCAAAALLADHSLSIAHLATTHDRVSDSSPPHWKTAPPIRPPWS